MIKINSPLDYKLLDNDAAIHPLVKQHLKDYCNEFLTEYDLENLDEIGAVFYVHNQADLDNHLAFGLSLPLDQALNEFCEVLIVTDGLTICRVLHVVYIFSDSCGISLMMDEKLPSEHLKSHWFEELLEERTVEIEV